MQSKCDAMLDNQDDPKRPYPVRDARKRDGSAERAESRNGEGREHHRHVIVSC
jgi:hypothetical protein